MRECCRRGKTGVVSNRRSTKLRSRLLAEPCTRYSTCLDFGRWLSAHQFLIVGPSEIVPALRSQGVEEEVGQVESEVALVVEGVSPVLVAHVLLEILSERRPPGAHLWKSWECILWFHLTDRHGKLLYMYTWNISLIPPCNLHFGNNVVHSSEILKSVAYHARENVGWPSIARKIWN